MTRNPDLLPQFRDIARFYKQHGEALRVRWDYAFFQMLIETNFLTYKTGSGRWGDVNPKQNNFAGIGTTGGGVPGDSFPDVSTGVLGQMQHLVAYSGEMVDSPVARRTREKQERYRQPVAIFESGRLRFGTWRADGRSIATMHVRSRPLPSATAPCSAAVRLSPSFLTKMSRATDGTDGGSGRARSLGRRRGRHAFNAAAMAGASSNDLAFRTASEDAKSGRQAMARARAS